MKPKYKRMLDGMKAKDTGSSDGAPWHLYMVECADGTFYTGVAKDLERRIAQHNTGKGAKYTRTRSPVRVVYSELCDSRSAALIRECAVKALPRQKKKSLTETSAVAQKPTRRTRKAPKIAKKTAIAPSKETEAVS